VRSYKKTVKHPIFTYLKKHDCPLCNNLLEVKEIRKTVHSESSEAKNYDFVFGECAAHGEVDFLHDVFYCSACEKEFQINDIYASARQARITQ